MNWHRVIAAVAAAALAAVACDTREIGGVNQFHDPLGNITFLTATKAG